MPPSGGPKRKRSDRNFSSDDGHRASPHRPYDLNLARQAPSQSHPNSNLNWSSQSRSNNIAPSRRHSRGPPNSAQTNQDDAKVRSPTPTSAPDVSNPKSSMPAPSTGPATNGVSVVTGLPTTSTVYRQRTTLYDHVTDRVVRNWSSDGRESVKTQLIALAEDDDITLQIIVEELIESATARRIDTHDAGLVIQESIASSQRGADVDGANPIQDAVLGAVPIIFAEESPNPHIAELAVFLSATGISPAFLRVELEAKLLNKLGLIRDSFHRTYIKKQTNALYRQANYNLLREESEGFSKLVTEMFTVSGKELPRCDAVNALVEKVKAMIGAFDLDVGRSLDVMLDVFGSVLVKQYRFFVKFLRASPWWPRSDSSTREVGRFNVMRGLPLWALPDAEEWYLTDDQRDSIASLAEKRDILFWQDARSTGLSAFFHLGQNSPALTDELDENLDADAKQFVQETGTLPQTSSREAAQLLGFKLRFYAPGAEGDSVDGTPRNLIYLAALLIKIGFISLHDLYPHLWRSDSDMDQLKETKIKEKKEREAAARPGAGAFNALASAGALSDDTAPATLPSRLRDQGTRASTPSKDSESDKPITKEPLAERPDQKVLLLQSLLAIGALPEALFILGRFPWMLDLIPELPDYIIRILHHALSEIYDNQRPLRARSSLQNQHPLYDTEGSHSSKGFARLDKAPQRRTLRWPLLDREDTEVDGINYKFYWDEWNDNIPICRSVDDVFTLSKILLPLIGAKVGQDTLLVLKFTRIGKASLRDDNSDRNRDRWLDLIKRVLLPSLSVTKANPGVINEVFDLISLYTTETRYKLYLEWLKGDTSRTNDMRSAFALARDQTRDVLKKISKTNIKPMARALAKVAYANPHIVITTALKQIESYDSIANVFVEGSRYFTDLGYDVLTWALVASMDEDNRIGVQADGIFTSKWLTALSHFIGNLYKRYNLMKPGPILQYVSKQLNKGISTDLIILEQLIVVMAGIIPDTSYNDAQLLAMGGGSLLQSQTLLHLQDLRHLSKPTAKRLMKALFDCGMISSLLLAIARQRQSCIFQENDAPLKAIGHKFDEITRVLGQYIDLLRTNLSPDESQTHVPSVTSMLNDWDVPAEIAFWVGRPVIQKQINDFDKDHVPAVETKDTNVDIDMKDDEGSEEDGEAIETEDVVVGAATPTEIELAGSIDENVTEIDDVSQQNWHPVLKNIMDEIRPTLSEDIQNLVGVGFYVTFWELSLYEIYVPSKSYEDEMSRNKKEISRITSDRSNVSSSSAKTRESSIKALRDLNDNLLAENRQHVRACGESRARLTREKDQWFAAKSRVSKELNVALMEHCFLPRILLSPLEAYFCFKFVKMLHSLGTANFRTLSFYDNFFVADRLSALFFMCTSKEADNLGKFLCEVLKDMARWHKSRSIYEREAFGSKKHLPGFALKLEHGRPTNLLDFDKFRGLLYKWQNNVYTALLKCLNSPEYMHVRNAISILRTTSTIFPSVDHHGRSLYKAIDRLGQSDREDVKIASQALLGTLKRRMKEWVSPDAFRIGSGAPVEQSIATPEKSKEELKPKIESVIDTKTRATPHLRSGDRIGTPIVKDAEQVSSSTSREARSPSRTNTPLPQRLTRDSTSLHPHRPDSRNHDLPRRISPPPRFPSSNGPPPRPEPDLRNGYIRPPRPLPTDTRPESRPTYPPRVGNDRKYDLATDSVSRYAHPSDRTSILDRDERLSRRDHGTRAEIGSGPEERRYGSREPRTDRESRSEREPRHDREHVRNPDREHGRPSDRDLLRPSDRPDRNERDRSHSEQVDRRREEGHQNTRKDLIDGTRNTTPTVSATAPAINPERAALIQANDDRPSMSIRGQAQDRARAARPTSPRRDDDRKHATRGDREDRQDRQDRRSEHTRTVPTVSQAPARIPPSTATPAIPPSRDTRNRGPVDLTHGRLEQDNVQRPSSRSDRGSDMEPPSGPRSRPSTINVRNPEPAAPVRPQQARQPPSGPGGRHSRNNSYVEPAMSPPTPDTTGVHPDRLNNLPSDHPRPPRPPPLQAPPPSGPRGAPTGPASAVTASPAARGPPSGPQSDIPLGRGQRHPMAAVNNTLVQAANGPRGPSGRGRGGMRQNSTSFPSGMPPSPISGPPNHGFSGPPPPDLINDNPNGMPIQPRGSSNRQDNTRAEEDRRPTRTQQFENRDYNARSDRDSQGYKEDRNMRTQQGQSMQDRIDGPQPPRNGPRGYPRGPNPNGAVDDGASQIRKHPRDETSNGSFGNGGRGGRVASDAKRPRRGGS